MVSDNNTLADDLQERISGLENDLRQIQEARLVWAMGCDCLCSDCKGFDKLIRSFPQIPNTAQQCAVSSGEAKS